MTSYLRKIKEYPEIINYSKNIYQALSMSKVLFWTLCVKQNMSNRGP